MTDNPAFIILAALQAVGWEFEDLDTESFLESAEYCDADVIGAENSVTI